MNIVGHYLFGYLKDESNECGGLQEREREREEREREKGLRVCVVCEKVTVEIQIHKHSAIVSQWTFLPAFRPLCEHRRSDCLEKI